MTESAKYEDAPTHTVSAGGVDFAYRELTRLILDEPLVGREAEG